MRLQLDLFRAAFSTNSRTLPSCKLCSAGTEPFDVVDFAKLCDANPYRHGFSGVPVYYYRCGTCECTFTEFFDKWSVEDFARFIYNEDYVLVDPDYVSARPEATAREWLIRFDMMKHLSVLDFGAGSGGFAQRMRGHGYRFESYDPFSSPSMPIGQFDAVTAFEVVEHSPDPIRTFETILSLMGERKIVLVGQSTQPDDIMTIRGNWWYIAPRNGHCTTYSEKSFARLAERFGLTYYPAFGLHGFFSDPEDEVSQSIIPRITNW